MGAGAGARGQDCIMCGLCELGEGGESELLCSNH
jgi:hypothetical protein